jgi:hypothetical protein
MALRERDQSRDSLAVAEQRLAVSAQAEAWERAEKERLAREVSQMNVEREEFQRRWNT